MKKSTIWIAAALLGVINAVVLYAFEFIGVDGTEWLWVDVFQTDTYRWMVLPTALLLGLGAAKLTLLLNQKRIVSPESDLMADMDASGPATLHMIGTTLAIGAASLLAGASLGPEASLMAFSTMIAIWLSSHAKISAAAKQLLVLASVGALLVAFLGSMLMVLVPLLVLIQKKQLAWRPVGVILLAGLLSYGTIWLIDHNDPGYGTVPPLPSLAEHDYVVALIIGFVTAAVAVVLNWLITQSWKFAKRLDERMTWYVSTAVFSLVLGVLYLVGGESVQFSGSIGSHLLAANAAEYGLVALVGLVVVKLLATAWSKGIGFRGGLVFPSIYVGLALGLAVGQLHSGWGGAGAMIGGIAGVLSAVTGSSVIAGIFVLAVLPVELLPVALCAIAGTILFKLGTKRLIARKS